MSNGKLGKAMSSSLAPVSVYQAPVSVDFVTASISLLNVGLEDAIVKVSIANSLTPLPVDYIESGQVVSKNGGRVIINCELLSAGERILVESTTNNVVIRATGLEKLL